MEVNAQELDNLNTQAENKGNFYKKQSSENQQIKFLENGNEIEKKDNENKDNNSEQIQQKEQINQNSENNQNGENENRKKKKERWVPDHVKNPWFPKEKKKKSKEQIEADNFQFRDEKHILKEINHLFTIEQEKEDNEKLSAEELEKKNGLSKQELEQMNFLSEKQIQYVQKIIQENKLKPSQFLGPGGMVISQKVKNRLGLEDESEDENENEKNQQNQENNGKQDQQKQVQQQSDSNNKVEKIEMLNNVSGLVQDIFAHGRNLRYIQISDMDNVAQIQIIVKRKHWKGKHGYQDMCSLIGVGSVINLDGYIGLSSFGKVSLFVEDFRVLDFPPVNEPIKNVNVFHFIKMYECGVISEKFLTRLLHCKIELVQLLQEKGRHLFDQYKLDQEDRLRGLGKYFKGSKLNKQYKVYLDVVAKVVSGTDVGVSRFRPPKIPQEFHNMLLNYENKYLKSFDCEYIDHSQKQIDNLLDILQFLPDQEDLERVNYIKQRKQPQIHWFLNQLKELWSVSAVQKKNPHIIDIGGGRGDLALSIAKAFPNVFITVIDINDKSLACGEEIAEQNQIRNINFKVCGVQDLQGKLAEIIQERKQKVEKYDLNQEYNEKLDLVVGLHPCGGLSDALLYFCYKNSLQFLICTCCFASLFELVPEEYFEVQKQFYFQEEDKKQICKNAEKHHQIYPISERCMLVVNLIRMNIFSKMINGNEKFKINIYRFSQNFSPKNFVLQGVWTKNEIEN